MSISISPASEPFVGEQFDDIEQQRDAAKLGMWIFLATEVLFFGGLFLGYTIYRFTYGHVFVEASRKLDVLIGGTNTAVLLISSLLMAFAVRAAKLDQRRALVGLLAGTALLGCVFMSLKAVEYHKDYVDHLVPRMGFKWEGADPGNAELFYWIYFAMTGLHAIHVTVGIGVLLVLTLLAWRGKFAHGNYNPVEITGLCGYYTMVAMTFARGRPGRARSFWICARTAGNTRPNASMRSYFVWSRTSRHRG